MLLWAHTGGQTNVWEIKKAKAKNIYLEYIRGTYRINRAYDWVHFDELQFNGLCDDIPVLFNPVFQAFAVTQPR